MFPSVSECFNDIAHLFYNDVNVCKNSKKMKTTWGYKITHDGHVNRLKKQLWILFSLKQNIAKMKSYDD